MNLKSPASIFITSLLRITLIVALPLLGGCMAVREAQHGCTLLVIVDGGQRLASPAQLESLERRVRPLLAERGLVLSHDPRNAGWQARVEFEADPNNPLDGNFAIRTIKPNPTIDAPRPSTPTDGLDSYRRAQDQSFQRQEQQLMRETPKPTT